MAYVAPTVELFKTRFPEFDPVDDDLVDLVLAEAVGVVDATWVERDRASAQMYLTAHLLTVQGQPARSIAGSSGSGSNINLTGPVKRRKVGDVETEYAGASSINGGSNGGTFEGIDQAYGATPYGRQYLVIRNRNFRAPLAV